MQADTIPAELRAMATRIDYDGTPSQIVTGDDLREIADRLDRATRPAAGAGLREAVEPLIRTLRGVSTALPDGYTLDISRADYDALVAAYRAAPAVRPAGGEADVPGLGHMRKISNLIEQLVHIKSAFGDTCVYIRRGGLSWGATALNYEADDAKNGVFDLQAKHDADMRARLEQIERLKSERDEWRKKALATPPADAGLIQEAIEQEREACARLCDEEAERRFANARAADAGDASWGVDLHASAMAQDNKAITARGLAATIRARATLATLRKAQNG